MKIKVQITRKENADFFHVSKGDIVEVEFEEYIAAVVASEIGNSNLEASKAQAIAARTLAISRNVLNGTPISDSSATDQAYRAIRYNSTFSNAITAANLTAGQVLYYNKKPISAVYCASNGGYTVSSEEKWGGKRPYLIAQKDIWDAAAGYPKQGHGVGMSQHGAAWAGAHGATYTQILDFYYPGTLLYDNYGQPRKELITVKATELLLLKEQVKAITDLVQKLKEEL